MERVYTNILGLSQRLEERVWQPWLHDRDSNYVEQRQERRDLRKPWEATSKEMGESKVQRRTPFQYSSDEGKAMGRVLDNKNTDRHPCMPWTYRDIKSSDLLVSQINSWICNISYYLYHSKSCQGGGGRRSTKQVWWLSWAHGSWLGRGFLYPTSSLRWNFMKMSPVALIQVRTQDSTHISHSVVSKLYDLHLYKNN